MTNIKPIEPDEPEYKADAEVDLVNLIDETDIYNKVFSLHELLALAKAKPEELFLSMKIDHLDEDKVYSYKTYCAATKVNLLKVSIENQNAYDNQKDQFLHNMKKYEDYYKAYKESLDKEENKKQLERDKAHFQNQLKIIEERLNKL